MGCSYNYREEQEIGDNTAFLFFLSWEYVNGGPQRRKKASAEVMEGQIARIDGVQRDIHWQSLWRRSLSSLNESG